MDAPTLTTAAAYLHKLCVEIERRSTGSPGNQAATDFFAGLVRGWGFEVETPQFECIDWETGGATLSAGGEDFQVYPGPYSLGVQAQGVLAAVSTFDQLQAADLTSKLLLIHGELAREQVMPKNFPFYNPEHHRALVSLLEAKNPLAIIAATERDPDMVGGGVYPFPLFEDGDFDIPNVYMTDDQGARLAAHLGEQVSLTLTARRIPSRGVNVLARKGEQAQRVVLMAHIDARLGTPGAGDNASGVITLLLLAELLQNYQGKLGIELLAMNGEDYFCNPGEQLYLAQHASTFDQVLLGINIDDVGYFKGKIAYSLYGCPEPVSERIEQVLGGYPELTPGEAWYQGDHSLLVMSGVPALAFTSDQLAELMAEITHTAKDTPEVIDTRRIVALAQALHALVVRLEMDAASKENQG